MIPLLTLLDLEFCIPQVIKSDFSNNARFKNPIIITEKEEPIKCDALE